MPKRAGKGKQKGSITVKSAAEDQREGQQTSGAGRRKEARRAAEVEEDDGLFAGPKLGSGPAWRVSAGKGASDAEKDGDASLYRCGAMLEQALSCSELADVKFVFDDGESGVRGHRGMLCSVSEEFCGMFGSGMAEAKSGEVRVRGVSRESFRGFLELLYLGRAGEEMARADGREVWVLADLYDVKGMKEWLMGDGLEGGSVCAALQYGMEGEGFLEGLVEACKKRAACEGLSGIGEEVLRGVSSAVVRVLLEAFLGRRPERVVEGLEYVGRWAKANGGLLCGHGDVDSLVGMIDLGKMRTQDLMKIVRPSGLVREAEVLDMYQRRLEESKLEGKHFSFMWMFGTEGDGPEQLRDPCCVAVGWKDGVQRVAVSDFSLHRVLVFDVRSRKCVLTLGSEEEGPKHLRDPWGVAFNHRGEIIVTDCRHHRICVFDWTGQFVRQIGSHGREDGMLDRPRGVAVNAHGDIIVVEHGNYRVQIFTSDGTFVQSFGSRGEASRQFLYPYGVAAGPDGMIVVSDPSTSRVQVFSAGGIHMRTISSFWEGQGQLNYPTHVAVSTHGEILVVDNFGDGSSLLRLFRQDGVCQRLIGREDIEGVDGFHPIGVCVDDEGHMFYCSRMTSGVMMLG